MNAFNRVLCVLSVVAVFAFVVGCGDSSRPDGMPALYPVTITLTQEKVPLEGASVNLVSADASNPWSAGGRTDAKGVAIIYARPDFKGAVAGKYKLVITKKEIETRAGAGAARNPNVPTHAEDGSPIAWTGNEGPRIMEEWTLIDPKYTKLETTPLEIEVTPQGCTESFDLGKAVREKLGK